MSSMKISKQRLIEIINEELAKANINENEIERLSAQQATEAEETAIAGSYTEIRNTANLYIEELKQLTNRVGELREAVKEVTRSGPGPGGQFVGSDTTFMSVGKAMVELITKLENNVKHIENTYQLPPSETQQTDVGNM